MHTKRVRFSHSIMIGAILVAALVWYQSTPRPRDVTVEPDRMTVVDVSDPQPSHATLTHTEVESAGETRKDVAEVASATSSTQRAPRPVSAEIAKVFPSITEEVRDWRQFRPEEITVTTHDSLPLTFSRSAVKEEGKYVTWIGRISALPGASFVGVATEAGYDAIVIIPGASQFSYHVRGDLVVVTEAYPSEDGCGVAPAYLPRSPVASAAGILLDVEYHTEHASVIKDSDPGIFLAKVDVLVVYNQETLNEAASRSTDPVGYIDGQSKAMIETGNVMLSESRVDTFEWRYLGSEAMPPYERTGKSLNDLRLMAPGGEHYTWTRMIRDYRGADQIIALIGGGMDYNGRAYAPLNGNVTSHYAVGVVRWGASAFTMVHELAHNFGCQHDREHVGRDEETGDYRTVDDGDGLWHYGHMWENPPLPLGWTGTSGTSGTIMSYAMWRIPYFSNPNMTVAVTGAMLDWGGQIDLGRFVIGRHEEDPRAADNVRVLNERAFAMSAIAEEIRMPVITRQPATTRFAPGTAMVMSVAATGGGLRYQWKKDGEDIVDALSATYTKTATDADAGRYSVEVYNYNGSVMSAEAVVTIGAPLPVPVTPPSNGGGGGGGGGSPSVWFYGALGVFGLIRWRMGARQASRR
jgi:hypothetical protein